VLQYLATFCDMNLGQRMLCLTKNEKVCCTALEKLFENALA